MGVHPLYEAIDTGNVDLLCAVLATQPECLERYMCPSDGDTEKLWQIATPLMVAFLKDQEAVFMELLAAGANINAPLAKEHADFRVGETLLDILKPDRVSSAKFERFRYILDDNVSCSEMSHAMHSLFLCLAARKDDLDLFRERIKEGVNLEKAKLHALKHGRMADYELLNIYGRKALDGQEWSFYSLDEVEYRKNFTNVNGDVTSAHVYHFNFGAGKVTETKVNVISPGVTAAVLLAENKNDCFEDQDLLQQARHFAHKEDLRRRVGSQYKADKRNV